MVKITISRPKEILVTFTKATLPGEFRIDQSASAQSVTPARRHRGVDRLPARSPPTVQADRLLAEKPKVGELQMDWLRSEDLKEEKNVTAPITMIAGEGFLQNGVAER